MTINPDLGDVLIMVARYSDNPDYRIQGRSLYPANKGFIGAAWCDGYCFTANLPDSQTAWDDYVSESQKTGINGDTIERLTMKSRSYCCLRLKRLQYWNKAVIVFESLSPTNLIEDQIKKVFNSEEDRLVRMLEVLEPVHANRHRLNL
jgi:hypothetical protein